MIILAAASGFWVKFAGIIMPWQPDYGTEMQNDNNYLDVIMLYPA